MSYTASAPKAFSISSASATMKLNKNINYLVLDWRQVAVADIITAIQAIQYATHRADTRRN